MKHIYCISGFGADERVFEKVDFGENDVHFIQWKIPEKHETIESYAARMCNRKFLIQIQFSSVCLLAE